jgi:hypothetical protein
MFYCQSRDAFHPQPFDSRFAVPGFLLAPSPLSGVIGTPFRKTTLVRSRNPRPERNTGQRFGRKNRQPPTNSFENASGNPGGVQDLKRL